MKFLAGGPNMPSVIARNTDIYTNHISKVLNQLKEHGLVVCINPEAKRGRFYRLTEKGEEIVKYFN